MNVKRRFVWFRGRSRREILVPFWIRIAAVTHFVQCFCVLFFECSWLLFLMILGALRLNFRSRFTSLLWALGFWKNMWKFITVVNFRGSTPSRRSLFAGLDCGCILMMSFCSFLWFFDVLEFQFWDLLGILVVEKEVWQKHICKKRA